ncbi:hypothetical protein GH733_000484 [Mirounga leonina]|nr:hypothetical protein GH733_000484 [Mirounga leonina]
MLPSFLVPIITSTYQIHLYSEAKLSFIGHKMQFSGGKRKKLRLTGDQRNVCYPHSLQFYLEPPSESISLLEFENLAIDRVKLLKAVENLGVSYVKGTEPYQSKLENEIRKLKFSFRENLENEYEPRRKDHISHFILRLAYCQSEDLRRWFIQQEMDLLRFRFSILPKDKIQNFLKDIHLHFEAIPFADALDLFRGRKVYLEGGFAYVPLKDIVAIVLNEFRAKLSKALALTARSLPAVQSDERLQPLLNHLRMFSPSSISVTYLTFTYPFRLSPYYLICHSYTGQDYSTQKNAGKISLDQIDSLSTKSFPPCMRQLHKALRENHHLRHGGRMQYGLFLKGIGLTLEQALQFWKQEFIRGKMDPDKPAARGLRVMGGLFGRVGLLSGLWAPGPSLLSCPSSGGSSWTWERTLVVVKPDAVQRRLVGDVIQRFERRGFKLVGMKMPQAPERALAEHYHDLQRKPFYPALISYVTSGPVVAMVWEGPNVVCSSRAMVGHTNSAEAAAGAIGGASAPHQQEHHPCQRLCGGGPEGDPAMVSEQ